jgi:lysophospholipase L1-like esterase
MRKYVSAWVLLPAFLSLSATSSPGLIPVYWQHFSQNTAQKRVPSTNSQATNSPLNQPEAKPKSTGNPSGWSGGSLRLRILDYLFSLYPSFQSKHLDQHLANYRHYLDTYGPPDILIVGSSRALQGIHPQQLQQALATQGYPRVKVYNFGINGATAQVVSLVLRQVLTPEQLPDVILWGDGLRAFNSGRTDKTYQAIKNSRAYEFLNAGIRPPLSEDTSLQTALCHQNPAPSTNTDANSNLVRSLWESQRHKLRQNWQQTVAEASITQLQEWDLENIPDFLQQSCPNFLEHPPENLPISTTKHQGEKTLDTWGFVAVSQQFQPQKYYQNYPKVPAKYDGDYQPFQLQQGPQIQALNEVIDLAKARNIPAIVVNLPLSQPYLETRRPYEAKFNQFMKQHAAKRGYIFRDLSQLWVNQYQYFEDPSHLNRYGAAAVSQHLASDRSIQWSSLLDR